MSERFAIVDDTALEAALRDLGRELAIPSIADRGTWLDPAARARARIAVGDVPRPWWRGWLVHPAGLPIRRSVALAAVAVLVIAVVAAAIGLGLPGIRIVPAPTASPAPSPTALSGASAGPSATPSATARPTPSPRPTIADPLGSNLGLGTQIALADAAAAVDVPVALPTAAGIGEPATVWLLDGRLGFVWRATATLPAVAEPGVGLLLGEFRGAIDPGYFEKLVGEGTTVATVSIGDTTGYWISGAPHEIVYVNAQGQPQWDSRRSVADTLLWARGDVTYRLESGLGRDATIALAETIR